MITFNKWLEQRTGSGDNKYGYGKHPKDYNNGKQGFIGDNPRYSGKNKRGKDNVNNLEFRNKEVRRDD